MGNDNFQDDEHVNIVRTFFGLFFYYVYDLFILAVAFVAAIYFDWYGFFGVLGCGLWVMHLHDLPGLPAKWKRNRRIKRGLCVECGYDLRGTSDAHECSECGAAIVKQSNDSPN